MSHIYFVQQEARPEQKIIFTSVDQKGGLGQLSQYVLENSGISVADPTPQKLAKGFHIESNGDRTIVFIVTVTNKTSTSIAFQENLGNALSELSINETDKSLWFPLMGTGSGGLSFHQSASIIKDAIEECIDTPLSKIIISLPREVDHNQQIEIEKIFDPNFVPEVALPEHIGLQVNDFLKAFPIQSLPSMTLSQYSNVKNRNYFTYWLEHETSTVGGVKGGSSFKFGIFNRRNKDKKVGNKTYSYTEDYAWYSRYGATKEVAFKTVLSHIVKTANCAAKGQLKEISTIPLDSRIKWKIAFLYQNFQKPKVVSIYKQEALQDLSELPPNNFSFAKAHDILIRRKPKNIDVWSYSKELWSKWSNDKPEKQFENTIVTEEQSDNQITTENKLEISEEEQDILLDNDVVHITGFVNDGLRGDDHLGIKNEVEALASIIAFKGTQPPLSIGIFGEWGSGKSFYMDLLQIRVEELASIARDSGVPQRQYPFYKHIKQIKFNAWNYVESDLWASLAHTIYQNLYQQDENSTKHDSHWLGIVKYGQEEVKEREKEIVTLENKLKRLDDTLNQLVDKEKELQNAGIEYDEKAVLQDKLETHLKDKCEKYLHEIGLSAQIQTVNDAISISKEISSLSNRFNLLYKAISNSSMASICFWLLIPLIVFMVTYCVTLKADSRDLLTTMAGIFAFASTSILWLKKRISIVSDWLSSFEKIQLEVSSLKNEKFANLKKIKLENIQSLKDTIAELNEKNSEKKKLLAEIKEAKLNLDELTPESVLAHHISQTLGDNRYGKFLGLPAILSQDFETLSKTIQQQNTALEDDEFFPTIADEEQADDAEYRINRIVLYIDDLDRCEPETVVKVLEAVHLFLASPLFIVVLGVDPRWLFSSIREHYASLMVESDSKNPSDFSTSTPEEYLEKIFQIPIWLETPSPESVKGLINSVVGSVVEQNKITKLSTKTLRARVEDSTDSLINEKDSVIGENVETASPLKNNATSTETELLIRAQHHILEATEIKFINGLSHILGRSPRSVKRYLNVYRLIKSSMDKNLYEQFINSIDDEEEGFKSVAFLLAIVVNYPMLTTDIFKMCATISEPTSIKHIVNIINDSDIGKGKNIADFVVSCKQLDCLEINLSSLNIWVKIVSRYSYSKLECK